MIVGVPHHRSRAAGTVQFSDDDAGCLDRQGGVRLSVSTQARRAARGLVNMYTTLCYYSIVIISRTRAIIGRGLRA